MFRMGESCELEEGEMTCSPNEALDVDLSYIDKKLHNVLGHLQKDVRVGSLDLFAVPSCQRSSIGNHAVQSFSNNLPMKNVVQKFQSLPTASCNLVSNHYPQNYQASGLDQAPQKVPIKNGNASIPGNDLSDLKPIRVRIKMGSEILSRKVTMVCNHLGLGDSPTSPSRNSHDDTHTSLEKTNESLSHILKEMTILPVPEDLLMSPLPGSLLLVKDKEKKSTFLCNEPVLKERKEPSMQTQNKFSDVLSCGKTLIGKRRKAVDCFDATTWNDTSSTGGMKKQKVFSSTSDGLQRGTKKDGASDPIVAFAKLNKMMVVGKQAKKDKKTYSTNLKQNSSKIGFGDKNLSKMPFKDAAYIGQNSMDIAAAATSTNIDVDNWAQCDSCETWRLLPFGLKTEQLPDKWLCSMQTWLPGINHCGISEEETTNATKSFRGTEGHFHSSNSDKSYQALTSSSLLNPIGKTPNVKDLSQGVSSNIPVDAAKPLRSNSHVFKKKNMKLPLETSKISRDLSVSHDSVLDKIDQKAKWRSAGTGTQIKIQKKKEGGKQESEIKTGDGDKLSRDIKSEEMHWKQDLEWTSLGRKIKHHDNDFYTSDVERDTKRRLLSSKKTPEHKSQVISDNGSLCSKSHGRTTSHVKASLAESVFTSPARSSCPKKHASAEESTSPNTQNLKYGVVGTKIVDNRRRLSQEAHCDVLSTTHPRNTKQPKPELCKQNSKFGDLPCISMSAERKNFSVSTHETTDRSCQAANDILQEAEKLRKLADCFKSSGFYDEHKEANFKAALKFLLGASLLEMCSTKNVERGKMSHVEAYHTAAKLSESCARQYETKQEMAAAALAYKCMEVACMRVVYGKSLGASGEWNELQKIVQMIPQGESPSSSASDVDSFCYQGMVDQSAPRTKRSLSHVAGNHFPVATSQLNFVPILDFTETMNLAMEASAKSQNSFRAVIGTSDCVSAIKKVVDFSFHDVEALIQMTELAMDVSKFRGTKC